MGKVLRVVLIALAVLAVAGAGAAAWYGLAPRQVPEGQPPLANLSDVGLDGLREAFNAASDRTRILMLASPT